MVGDSPVVPPTTMPEVPLATCQSSRRAQACQSISSVVAKRRDDGDLGPANSGEDMQARLLAGKTWSGWARDVTGRRDPGKPRRPRKPGLPRLGTRHDNTPAA